MGQLALGRALALALAAICGCSEGTGFAAGGVHPGIIRGYRRRRNKKMQLFLILISVYSKLTARTPKTLFSTGISSESAGAKGKQSSARRLLCSCCLQDLVIFLAAYSVSVLCSASAAPKEGGPSRAMSKPCVCLLCLLCLFCLCSSSRAEIQIHPDDLQYQDEKTKAKTIANSSQTICIGCLSLCLLHFSSLPSASLSRESRLCPCRNNVGTDSFSSIKQKIV
ncbi:hypothetical protein BZA70DRAFT_46699 [Myxozyma melibiosi]|uniref:Uncharacterized protein n=1 Tax=Myxozyma melibiosi TaxID=54550 RepID=A0ABR1FEV2_9ASCO